MQTKSELEAVTQPCWKLERTRTDSDAEFLKSATLLTYFVYKSSHRSAHESRTLCKFYRFPQNRHGISGTGMQVCNDQFWLITVHYS